MIKEFEYQKEAVEDLVKKTISLLEYPGDRRKLVFESPTGSGKTVMASQMLDELTEQLSEEDKQVALIWIAPNKLHQQSYMKMKNYFSETHVLTPVMYDELDHTSEGYIKPGEVFFVNWESINKDTNLMVKETENSSSIYDIVTRTQEHGIPVIVIIDEEHMFGTRSAKQSEKVLKNINPKLEIRISATPSPISKAEADETVIIPRHKVINAEMIKNGITINPDVREDDTGIGENAYLMDLALAKRKEIKQAYEEMDVRVNPLLLIQLPNDNSATLDSNEKTIIEQMKTRLDSIYGINKDNGKLAVWLSNEKTDNLDHLSDNYDLTEVLLFKQAIALGWDCPRAAVLLIFRDIKSEPFGMQTVGRIMRMPEQHYYTEEILNHGWIYTNLSRDHIIIRPEAYDYVTKSLQAYRREHLNNVALPSTYSQYLSADRNRLGPDFWRILVDTFNRNWFKIPVEQDLFEVSPFEDDAASTSNYSKVELFDWQRNRQQAELVDRVDFGNHAVKVTLIHDVNVTGEAGTTEIDENQQIGFRRSQDELNSRFTKFCQDLLVGYEKIAVTSLKGYIYQLMEEYLGVFEPEVPRIILYNQNQGKFARLIALAITQYTKILNLRRKKKKERSLAEYTWEVPENREYNETTAKEISEIKDHALMPFFRLDKASEQEKKFEAFLEENKEYVDWWYKNGDGGRYNYAVPYVATDGIKTPFYVDYVIRMKNGQLFLFDTKTEDSDPEAPNKHNALLEYMQSEQNKEQHLMGGVIIFRKLDKNWCYSPLPIENTTDLSGWDAFFPDKYKD